MPSATNPADQLRAAKALIDAPEEPWFCDRGNFWGTPYQILVCAKCGKHEKKRHDEPRHYAALFTPNVHTICDDCFDGLPITLAEQGDGDAS